MREKSSDSNTDEQDTDPVRAVTPSLHYNMLYSTKSGPSQNSAWEKFPACPPFLALQGSYA